ncbi:MAG: hypothetical protein OXF24_06200, partial [Hyphomicrobiales bacterium]|nr:hypothetical protein [Hyphomicrobiales bacterium]
FSIGFDDENEGFWFDNGHVTLFAEKTYVGGLVPLTITITDDEGIEGTETFTISIAARPIGFPTDSWEVDEDNNSFTLNINDNDPS